MKQRQKQFRVFFLLAFLVCTLIIVSQSTTLAEDAPHTIIVLKQAPEAISPQTVKVKVGTSIIWVNNDKGPVTIKFKTKLGIACKVPVNFFADLFGYYETGQIPQGGTASICFIEPGEFHYEVRRLHNKKEEVIPGKIIVTR